MFKSEVYLCFLKIIDSLLATLLYHSKYLYKLGILMCGINGYFRPYTITNPEKIIHDMNLAIQHRGPDANQFWMDEKYNLLFGHCRLAIQDLSNAGKQPMHSVCGRYVIIFNGEIYNHFSLREQLTNEGFTTNWRGHSDTETLLACFTLWGVRKTLQNLVGMFAIALWDRHQELLTLARDRLGEKPLYWGWQGEKLYFSSELKALKANPFFKTDIDRNSITLLLRHNCIPAPYSIYKGIYKLKPGHYVQLSLSKLTQAQQAKPIAYWSFNHTVEAGLETPFVGSPEQAIDTLEEALLSSVGNQMLSDVPLGAFLSGGIDSSTIVALMQAQSSKPIKTFTIGFDDEGYNEAKHAKTVARHLGTEHTELYIQASDALNVIPKLPDIYSEPFSDSSQIPTFLVSELASQHVKVALSGDGGDELFGGYNRYLMAQNIWKKSRKVPKHVRKLISNILLSVPPNKWDDVFNLISPALPKSLRIRTFGDKTHKLASILGLNNNHEYYRTLTSHWQQPDKLVIGACEPPTLVSNYETWPITDSFEHAMMAIDAQTYMTDDILVKVDRAAMANSLETRVPFLDHRIIELAWKMPLEYKIQNGEGKWLLKQVLFRHVPQELIERPKMGFGIPLHDWLRSSLRDWAEDLLDENLLNKQGYFHPQPIRRIWLEHLSGEYNHQHHLWDILMFQAWLKNNNL